jgi:hypothetical protein
MMLRIWETQIQNQSSEDIYVILLGLRNVESGKWKYPIPYSMELWCLDELRYKVLRYLEHAVVSIISIIIAYLVQKFKYIIKDYGLLEVQ